jgi:hypothetical protein
MTISASMNSALKFSDSAGSKTMPQQVNSPSRWGLLACGSSNQWQIDVDESQDGSAWALQFEGPNFCLRFAIPELQVVHKLLAYLQGRAAEEKNGISLTLGVFGLAAVSVIHDDEIPTRWAIRIHAESNGWMHFTLDQADVRMIIDALEQVIDQLR